MTDTEMADEYFKTTYPSYIGYDKFVEYIKDAFLDGLKARKTKWHKVADGDLPKENHFVFVYNKRTGYEIARHTPFQEYCMDNWVTNDNRSLETSVIAWCEIPKFEENI